MRKSTTTALLSLASLPWLVACPGSSAPQAAPPPAQTAAAATTADLMVTLHQHHDKLGYALGAGNQPLAKFYLQKVQETLAAAEYLEPLDGLPVSSMVPAMMAGSVNVISPQIEQADFTSARETYRSMTMACNSCHAATRREFIVILPAEGEPRFNQQFKP